MQGLPVLSIKQQARRAEALKMNAYWGILYWKARIMELNSDDYDIYDLFLEDFSWLKYGLDESTKEYEFHKGLQYMLSL